MLRIVRNFPVSGCLLEYSVTKIHDQVSKKQELDFRKMQFETRYAHLEIETVSTNVTIKTCRCQSLRY